MNGDIITVVNDEAVWSPTIVGSNLPVSSVSTDKISPGSDGDILTTESGNVVWATPRRPIRFLATSNGTGDWSVAHGLGVVPEFATAMSVSPGSGILDQSIVTITSITSAVVTGKVIKGTGVLIGGITMAAVSGAPVQVMVFP